MRRSRVIPTAYSHGTASPMRLATSIQQVPKTAATITVPHLPTVSPVVLRRTWTIGTLVIDSTTRSVAHRPAMRGHAPPELVCTSGRLRTDVYWRV